MQRFRTIFTLVFIWIILASVSMSAAGLVTSKRKSVAPKAVFHKPNHSFGEVFEGAEVKHDFVVENQGTAPLVIKRISPD